MYFVNFVLQYYSRSIFLQYLGAELLGLNTTVTNLLQFLNIAELGIGIAIGFTLYKPLFDDDKDAINEILTIQRWYYKRIAFFIILGSIVLMAFFPLIFKKAELSLWYAYSSYAVVLIGALLSYYFNYRQVLLSADQKDYKIQYSYKAILLAKIIAQIFAVKYLSNPYIYWLILELLFSIIATIGLSITIKSTYSYLHTSSVPIKQLKDKHSILTKKIGQVFYHKIGDFALSQSSPVIIYAYASLTLVTVYGNYLILVNALISLVSAVFNSMAGGIGNLVAGKDLKRIISVFKELFSLRFLLNSTLCVGFYILSSTIINFWIGKEYIFQNSTTIIIVSSLFINLNRSTVDNFIGSLGLFSDIYAPLVQAVLCIGLSILLGYHWNLNGILAGVLISQIVMIFCWKPYYLFKKGFKLNLRIYLNELLKNLLSGGISFLCILIFAGRYTFEYCIKYRHIIKYLMLIFGYFVLCLMLQLLFKTGIRNFAVRISRRRI